MNKQTRQTLCELAEIYMLLQTCENRLSHIPARFKNLYLDVPSSCLGGLRSARLGLEDFARQLLEFQNLPALRGGLSYFLSSQRSMVKKQKLL